MGIIDKSPKLRTVDEKNMLQSLSKKIRKFPKNLIDGIQKQFPRLQRTPKTAEQRKEQAKECMSQKRAAESDTDKEMRKEQAKECMSQKRAAESETDKEMRKEQDKECKRQKREERIAESQIVCDICNSSNHLCRKCKNTVCNFCGERDPSSDNEMHIMHKENDTRCTVGESEIERQRRLNNQKEYANAKRSAESEKDKEMRMNKQQEYA